MTEWIVSSTALILIMLLVRRIFEGRISPRLQYAIWLLVMLRLLLPISLGESSASVTNYVNLPEPGTALSLPLSQALPDMDSLPAESGSLAPAEKPEPQSPAEKPVVNMEIDHTQYLNTRLRPYLIWLSGAACVGLMFLTVNLSFYLKLRRSRERQEDYKGRPVYVSAALETPCLFGLIRPAIYLSAGLDEKVRSYALGHEYEHFRQGDQFWSMLRCACLALHWYNPLVWLAARLSRRDAELSCDQRVMKSLDEEQRLEYGGILIMLSSRHHVPLFSTATTMSGKGKQLKKRIQLIARQPRMLRQTVLGVLLLSFLAVGCTFTGAEEEAEIRLSEVDITAEPIEETAPAVLPLAEWGDIYYRGGEELEPKDYPELFESVSVFMEQKQAGNSVYITIDKDFQDKVAQLLNEQAAGRNAAAVVLDVKTGAPLALVSSKMAKSALVGAYTPGPLMLPCTGISAIDTGIFTTDYEIQCEGLFDRYAEEGYTSSCWIWEHGFTHEAENLTEALRDCCGYYFTILGNDMGVDLLEEHALTLGLGTATGIELPENYGLMANREDIGQETGRQWRIGDTLEAARGESFSRFTLLQYAQYCAALANNGGRYSASILDRVESPDGELLYSRQARILDNGFPNTSDTDWQAVKQGMYEYLNNQRYVTDNYLVWQDSPWKAAGMDNPGDKDELFMCYAPYDQPLLSIAVYIDDMAVNNEAQFIAREIIEAYMETLA